MKKLYLLLVVLFSSYCLKSCDSQPERKNTVASVTNLSKSSKETNGPLTSEEGANSKNNLNSSSSSGNNSPDDRNKANDPILTEKVIFINKEGKKFYHAKCPNAEKYTREYMESEEYQILYYKITDAIERNDMEALNEVAAPRRQYKGKYTVAGYVHNYYDENGNEEFSKTFNNLTDMLKFSKLSEDIKTPEKSANICNILCRNCEQYYIFGKRGQVIFDANGIMCIYDYHPIKDLKEEQLKTLQKEALQKKSTAKK